MSRRFGGRLRRICDVFHDDTGIRKAPEWRQGDAA
jgi:hypothetical protein